MQNFSGVNRIPGDLEEALAPILPSPLPGDTVLQHVKDTIHFSTLYSTALVRVCVNIVVHYIYLFTLCVSKAVCISFVTPTGGNNCSLVWLQGMPIIDVVQRSVIRTPVIS